MAEMVLMPQMGISEESAVLANWQVKEGDDVTVGQVLFVLETGKSSFECQSEHNGTVLKFFASEGDEVNVGVPVCAIGQKGEKVDAPASAAAAAVVETIAAAPAVAPAAAVVAASAPAAATMGDGKSSPRARMLAENLGVNVNAATPSGPNGRIIERDVRTLIDSGLVDATVTAAAAPVAAPAAQAPVAAYEEKPLSRIRKVIAENMHKSLSEMAQLTLNRTFDATNMMAFRKKAKASKGYGLENLTLNDFILFAVSRTLLDFPELNAYFLGDKMRYFNNVNLAVAVDTPRGLMVPVLFGAEKMSIAKLSEEVKAKAAACKDGNIDPALLTGGSFTISNLGAMGIESFTPVINAPQTAILGVDALMLRPRETEDGEIEFYQAMGLSLTFDHRAADGAPAAKFLKVLAERLENIELLLAM